MVTARRKSRVRGLTVKSANVCSRRRRHLRRHGRLAVGPGDADDRDVRRRVAVDGSGRRAHRFTDVRHDKLRYSHVEATFDEHGDGTGLDGRRRVVMAVGCLAGNTGEEVARADTPRVVFDVDDVDDRVVGLDHRWQRGAEIVEPHVSRPGTPERAS